MKQFVSMKQNSEIYEKMQEIRKNGNLSLDNLAGIMWFIEERIQTVPKFIQECVEAERGCTVARSDGQDLLEQFNNEQWDALKNYFVQLISIMIDQDLIEVLPDLINYDADRNEFDDNEVKIDPQSGDNTDD